MLTWLLPNQTLTIETTLTARQVCERLRESIGTGQRCGAEFRGRIHGSAFEFEAKGDRALLAMSGEVVPTRSGACLSVEIAPTGDVAGFALLWLLGSAGMSAGFTVAGVWPWLLLPYASLGVGLALAKLTLGKEAHEARRFLLQSMLPHVRTPAGPYRAAA